MNPKIIALYFALLLAHIAHVFEVIWANFRRLDFWDNFGFLM